MGSKQKRHVHLGGMDFLSLQRDATGDSVELILETCCDEGHGREEVVASVPAKAAIFVKLREAIEELGLELPLRYLPRQAPPCTCIPK